MTNPYLMYLLRYSLRLLSIHIWLPIMSWVKYHKFLYFLTIPNEMVHTFYHRKNPNFKPISQDFFFTNRFSMWSRNENIFEMIDSKGYIVEMSWRLDIPFDFLEMLKISSLFCACFASDSKVDEILEKCEPIIEVLTLRCF